MSPALKVDEALVAVERVCRNSGTADELLDGLSSEMHRLIPHDGSAWFGVDPTTMIATTPSRVEHLDPGMCDAFWHLEFHEQDVLLYSELARGVGTGSLNQMLDGQVAKSVRFRELVDPLGYADELRSTFRHGTNTWGVVSLYREDRRRPFDAAEVELLKSLNEPIAGALRSHVRAVAPWLAQPSAPGLVVVDRDGRAVSINREARSWLCDFWPLRDPRSDADDGALDVYGLRDEGDGVPTPLFALIARARAVADGRERSPARLRMRDRRGRWLVFHASVLDGPATGSDDVALVVEAAKSAEIAPIIIEAYALTPRERDVLSAIARGGSTGEIAAELFLSPHTVRDYVKTVFEKVGVSSRGELVARLFGEHYADRLHQSMVHEG